MLLALLISGGVSGGADVTGEDAHGTSIIPAKNAGGMILDWLQEVL